MVGKATIREASWLAGVSPSVVSRVLNGTDANHIWPMNQQVPARIVHGFFMCSAWQRGKYAD